MHPPGMSLGILLVVEKVSFLVQVYLEKRLEGNKEGDHQKHAQRICHRIGGGQA